MIHHQDISYVDPDLLQDLVRDNMVCIHDKVYFRMVQILIDKVGHYAIQKGEQSVRTRPRSAWYTIELFESERAELRGSLDA